MEKWKGNDAVAKLLFLIRVYEFPLLLEYYYLIIIIISVSNKSTDRYFAMQHILCLLVQFSVNMIANCKQIEKMCDQQYVLWHPYNHRIIIHYNKQGLCEIGIQHGNTRVQYLILWYATMFSDIILPRVMRKD